jgi:predicted dehydrogenase
MSRYRIGLVGANRGSGLVHPFSVYPETEIAALCDLDEKRLADAAEHYRVEDRYLFTSYPEFLNAPIDIVVIGTPIQLHAEQAIAALDAGKHVLSEVTAAWTIAQCEQIVNAVKRNKQVYMLAENNCYLHYIRIWKKWIDAGRLGDIFYAEAEYIHDIRRLLWDDASGEAYWRLERPPIYYCTHSLGPLLMLMDDRVVQATGAHSGYGIVPDRGPSCLNMEVALFKTQKGAVIKVLRSQVALREPSMHYYSLYGTKGCVENGREGGWVETNGQLYVEGEMGADRGFEVIHCPNSDPEAPPEAFGGGHGTIEYSLVRDFIDTLECGSLRPPIDVIKAMDMTVPGICAHEAAMSEGRWVDVPQFEW